jgi:sulfur-oxidizing protein SoxY
MDTVRRTLLAALTLAVLRPLAALAAWNKDAFGAKSATDALKSLGLGGTAPSKDLTIDAPQIAENGAVVPIEVSSAIPGTSALSVIIEKNPFPLVARFEFKEGALPFVKVNVKMGETSDIRAIAEAGGRSYSATREVKVTIGGCGG